MSEAKKSGFLSRLFGGAPEPTGSPDAHLPSPQHDDQHPDVASAADATGNVRGGPDADIHGPAMASTIADEEAGAKADAPMGGGIIPLAEAQKKTP